MTELELVWRSRHGIEEEKVSESKATWVRAKGRGSVGMSGWWRAGGKKYVREGLSYWIRERLWWVRRGRLQEMSELLLTWGTFGRVSDWVEVNEWMRVNEYGLQEEVDDRGWWLCDIQICFERLKKSVWMPSKSRSKCWGVGLRQRGSVWGQDSASMQTTWAMQSFNHYNCILTWKLARLPYV